MNKDRMQPDGSQLTIASLIRPGWILRMPQRRVRPRHRDREPGQRRPGARAGHAPPGAAAGQAAPGTRPTREPRRRMPLPGHAPRPRTAPRRAGTLRPPEAPASGAAAARPVRPGDNALAAPGQQAPDPLPYPYELSAASLLAAGVLAALGRRRREQLWRRAFGQRIAVPDGPAAMAENALRFGADEPSVRLLDVGLRQLSQALASQDKALPTVFAAHIGAENLDLWVAPADPSPPAPWTAADGGAVWRLPLDAVERPGPGWRQRRARPVPRPRVDRDERDRPDPRRPGGRARADRGARPAPPGAGGAGRARRRAGHQPLVRPDADHAGRFRRGADHDRARAGDRRGHPGRGAAGPAGPRRRGGAGPGRIGPRLRAHRAVPDRRRADLGAALPDHGRPAHPDAAGAAAHAGPDPAPFRARLRRRR